jgi:uncharacterized membrane protein YoaK (UPF0700 family)
MALASPVAHRPTILGLLALTFATGLVDAISVLVLGHVFVANMTGNLVFLGFWFVPHSGIGSDSRLAGGNGHREKLRYLVVLTMVAGAVVGATLSRFVVAPVIALAALSVAAGLAILRHGPAPVPGLSA